MPFAIPELNQQMLPVFLGILLAAAIAWLLLSYRLLGELRQNYPKLYEALAWPDSFRLKSFLTNFKVISFLFRREHEAKDNPAVINLCRGLRSLFYIYVVCLAGSLVLIFAGMV